MKTRVLFILADLETGGAQRVVLTVARHVSREKFFIHLALIRGTGPLGEEIPGELPVHNLKIRRVRYALPSLLELIWRLKPDIVLSTLGHLNVGLLLVKPLLPGPTRLVIREANTPSMRLKHTAHPGLYRFLYRRVYPFADGIICNSEFMRRDLTERFFIEAGKTEVIPNPVDVERITGAVAAFPNPYASGNYNVVSVGRLTYQKGFDLLLRAFAEAREIVPDLLLTLVGGGEEERSLRDLAHSLGCRDSVAFTGYRSNPYPYMAHADLFVSSSRWEGSPNAVLESLACRTPVLAFDCPGGTGEILHADQNGWLAPPEDWKALGRRIAEIAGTGESRKFKGGDLLPPEFTIPFAVGRYEEVLLSRAGASMWPGG